MNKNDWPEAVAEIVIVLCVTAIVISFFVLTSCANRDRDFSDLKHLSTAVEDAQHGDRYYGR